MRATTGEGGMQLTSCRVGLTAERGGSVPLQLPVCRDFKAGLMIDDPDGSSTLSTPCAARAGRRTLGGNNSDAGGTAVKEMKDGGGFLAAKNEPLILFQFRTIRGYNRAISAAGTQPPVIALDRGPSCTSRTPTTRSEPTQQQQTKIFSVRSTQPRTALGSVGRYKQNNDKPNQDRTETKVEDTDGAAHVCVTAAVVTT